MPIRKAVGNRDGISGLPGGHYGIMMQLHTLLGVFHKQGNFAPEISVSFRFLACVREFECPATALALQRVGIDVHSHSRSIPSERRKMVSPHSG